jgi:hypothetical protein
MFGSWQIPYYGNKRWGTLGDAQHLISELRDSTSGLLYKQAPNPISEMN